MNIKLLKICALVGMVSITGYAEGAEAEKTSKAAEKPTVQEAVIVTANMKVTAVNKKTREVTLQTPKGDSFTIVADDEVRNFSQIKVGDTVNVEYMEGVLIEVVDRATKLGAVEATAAARAKPGEKPGAIVVNETSVVVVIEAIDLKHETATLKNAQGQIKTVKARNPDNLKKVAVGDKVMITYTEAVAIAVTEK